MSASGEREKPLDASAHEPASQVGSGFRPHRLAGSAVVLGVIALAVLIYFLTRSTSPAPTPKLTPAEVTQTLNAGYNQLQSNHLAAARSDFEEVLATDPANYLAHYDLGVLDQQVGDDQQAVSAYQAALAENPTYVSALFNEAIIVAKTDRAQAIVLYQAVIKIQPDAPTAYLNLGYLYYQMKDFGAADLAFGKALSEDPALASRLPPSPPATSSVPTTKVTAAGKPGSKQVK